jgi:hypothetical protein
VRSDAPCPPGRARQDLNPRRPREQEISYSASVDSSSQHQVSGFMMRWVARANRWAPTPGQGEPTRLVAVAEDQRDRVVAEWVRLVVRLKLPP